MADITVRLATEQDVPDLTPLIRSLAASYGEPLPVQEAMVKTVTQQIETDSYEYVVAKAQGRIFGCLLVCYHLSTWAAAPYAVLQDFIVEDSWRNQGVGSTMLAYARDRARIKGCARIELHIRSRNRDAKRFFERWGFAHTDRELMRMKLLRPRKHDPSDT